MMTSLLFAATLSTAQITTNAWPFAILRNYGSYEDNRDFLSRVFAAQERHPGLIGEIWFASGIGDPFVDPDGMGARAEKTNGGAREICRDLGIRFSYQQGVTLNHDPDDVPHPGIPDDAWVVDAQGKVRRGVFCCTSPFALDFSYRKAKSIMAALRPDSYWPDDDLRILKVDWSKPGICFCPRCLDLFGKRVGRTFTREELFNALSGAHPSAEIRREWCAFNGEMLDRYAKTFRDAADAASPETRLGIQACVSGYTANGDFYRRVLGTFAGERGRAGIRPGGGYYSDLDGKPGLIDKMLGTAREAARSARHPKIGQICYEIENWPHIGAKKNPGAMMAECALSLAFGCDSIAFYWGADQNGESPESYDFWLDTMAAWRPFHLAVRDTFSGTSLGGLAVCHDGSGHFATDGWFKHCDGPLSQLAASAVPVTVVEAAPDALIVDGKVVGALTADDLPRVFSRPVLTDIGALTALKARFPSVKFPNKVEILPLERELALATAVRACGYERFGTYGRCENVTARIRIKSGDVVPYSVMTADTNACGTCVIPTEFGGKTVLVQSLWPSWNHNVWPGCRRHGILDALDAAVPGGMPVRVMTDGYALSVSVRKTPDGRTAGAFILNLGGGPTPSLDIAVRRGVADKWTAIYPDGTRVLAERVDGQGEGVTVRIPPLQSFGAVLIAPGM